MDLLIKNMEMPKYCYVCPTHNPENGSCQLGVETSGLDVPKNCLLVEVPPHGDLVERSDVIKEIEKILCIICRHRDECSGCPIKDYIDAVINIPSVLEASK